MDMKSMTIRAVAEHGGSMEVTVFHTSAWDIPSRKSYRNYLDISDSSFYRLARLINRADNGLPNITVTHSLFPTWLSVHIERIN